MKSILNIRNSNEADWQRIIDIYNQSVSEKGKTADTEPQTVAGRKDWLSQHVTLKYPILVAEMDNLIIGWCSLSAHRPGRKALDQTLEISYYIDKEFRGRGIGSKLISEAINTAKNNGIKSLFAILLDINTDSVRILEKFGFEKWGHLPRVAEVEGRECGQFIFGKHI